MFSISSLFSKPVYSIVFSYYCNTCNSFYLDVNYRKPATSVTHIYSLALTHIHSLSYFTLTHALSQPLSLPCYLTHARTKHPICIGFSDNCNKKKNNHENREKAQKLFRNNFILEYLKRRDDMQ